MRELEILNGLEPETPTFDLLSQRINKNVEKVIADQDRRDAGPSILTVYLRTVTTIWFGVAALMLATMPWIPPWGELILATTGVVLILSSLPTLYWLIRLVWQWVGLFIRLRVVRIKLYMAERRLEKNISRRVEVLGYVDELHEHLVNEISKVDDVDYRDSLIREFRVLSGEFRNCDQELDGKIDYLLAALGRLDTDSGQSGMNASEEPGSG